MLGLIWMMGTVTGSGPKGLSWMPGLSRGYTTPMPSAEQVQGSPYQWESLPHPGRLPATPGEPLHSVGTLRTREGPSEKHRPSGKGLGTWTLLVGAAVGPCSHCLCSDTQEAGEGLAMASWAASLG